MPSPARLNRVKLAFSPTGGTFRTTASPAPWRDNPVDDGVHSVYGAPIGGEFAAAGPHITFVTRTSSLR